MTADTVLLVTASYDAAPEFVGAALKRRSIPFFRLDTDRFPTEVQLGFDPQGEITVSDGDRSISGKEVKSVWYRRNVSPKLPEDLDPGVREFCERETRMFLEGALASLPTQRWLSCPQAIRGAERKPYQLSIAAQLGFTLPRTIITNDPTAVRSFARNRNRLVAKAVSSGYIADPHGNRAIFTSALSTPDYSWNMLIRASDPAFSGGRSPVSLEPLSIRLNRLKNRAIEPVINRLTARRTVTRRQVDFPVRNSHRFGPFHGPDASAVHYPGAQDTRASLCHNRFQSVAP